jgi:hypothetical protein
MKLISLVYRCRVGYLGNRSLLYIQSNTLDPNGLVVWEMILTQSICYAIYLRFCYEERHLRYDLNNIQSLMGSYYAICRLWDSYGSSSPEDQQIILNDLNWAKKAFMIGRRFFYTHTCGKDLYLSKYNEPNHWYWKSLNFMITSLVKFACNYNLKKSKIQKRCHELTEELLVQVEKYAYWICYTRIQSLGFRYLCDRLSFALVYFHKVYNSTDESKLMLALAQGQYTMFDQVMEMFGSCPADVRIADRYPWDSLWITGSICSVITSLIVEVKETEYSKDTINFNRFRLQIFHMEWLMYAKQQIKNQSNTSSNDTPITLQDVYWRMMQTLSKVHNIYYYCVIS